jgi:hypothetical protein
METTTDLLNNPSYAFRVWTQGDRRTKLHASCVIETSRDDPKRCNILILNIADIDLISMKELRPKIKASVMALGFTDYAFNRSYCAAMITNKV